MNTLIIGGAGFIGSHLADKLISLGNEVTIIDDLSNGTLDNLKKSCRDVSFKKTDVSKTFLDKIKHNSDVIYYLACHPRSRSFQNPLRDLEVNVGGMINTIELALKCNAQIIFSSNSGIYNTNKLPINECNSDDPKTPYDLNKKTAEEYLKLYGKSHSLKYIIFRFATIYGPRQRTSLEWKPVIAEFIDKLSRNQAPYITGDGGQTRSFTYVGDIVEALIKAPKQAEANYMTMLLGTSEETSINSLYQITQELLETNIAPIKAPEPKGEIQRMNYDCSLAKAVLGWKANTSLREGIQSVINYNEENK